MPVSEDNVSVQAVVSKKTAEKIDLFAERFEVSRSKMVAIILENSIENDNLLLQLVSSGFVKRFARGLGIKKKEIDLKVIM